MYAPDEWLPRKISCHTKPGLQTDWLFFFVILKIILAVCALITVWADMGAGLFLLVK